MIQSPTMNRGVELLLTLQAYKSHDHEHQWTDYAMV